MKSKPAVMLLIILVAMGAVSAEFLLNEVIVTIYDIKPDGTAKVSESVKLIIKGAESQSDYDNGFSSNDISFWSSVTKVPDVKYHVNPAKVAINDLRVLPQPRKKCNPIQEICHGELLIEYETGPIKSNGSATPGTGLFNVEQSKPRTTRYTLNPDALSFLTTPQGNILLAENVNLVLRLPEDAVLKELNPRPEGIPAGQKSVTEIKWRDMILVKLAVVFEVEETLEKEVSGFFYDTYAMFNSMITGEYGWALIAIIAIVVSSYVYITLEQKERGRR